MLCCTQDFPVFDEQEHNQSPAETKRGIWKMTKLADVYLLASVCEQILCCSVTTRIN